MVIVMMRIRGCGRVAYQRYARVSSHLHLFHRVLTSRTFITQTSTNAALPSYISILPPGPYKPEVGSPTAYASLGGLTTQISHIRSLLELPLSHPELYHRFGLKPPRGILLHGPPGTGKTHLARAVASSTPGCSCIVVNGPELSGAYHGETEERLRAVFEEAKKREPCIVVLDEIDALCPRRDGGDGGEVERRVVATLLTLMDGMSGVDDKVRSDDVEESAALGRVVVIAATNRPNAIDPALRRPGRFDRELEIGECKIKKKVGHEYSYVISHHCLPRQVSPTPKLALRSLLSSFPECRTISTGKHSRLLLARLMATLVQIFLPLSVKLVLPHCIDGSHWRLLQKRRYCMQPTSRTHFLPSGHPLCAKSSSRPRLCDGPISVDRPLSNKSSRSASNGHYSTQTPSPGWVSILHEVSCCTVLQVAARP